MFHHKAFDVLHTNEFQPEFDVTGLVFEPGITDTRTGILTLSTNMVETFYRDRPETA